jgi:hypothetical protein
LSRDVACHVLHFRSAVDDTDQPVVFSMPTLENPSSSVACIILSHDTLDPPTRERFIDVAVREAHRWLPSLTSSNEPVILLQPMSRGNAEGIGLAGRDLLEAIHAVQEDRQVTLSPIYLAGVGAGATRSLQWATLWPSRWSGVALAGALWDERLDPAGDSPPAWEEPARESIRPAELASNLSGLRLLIEHPWWFDGIGGTSSARQFNAMKSQLSKPGFEVSSRQHVPLLLGATDWPSQPNELVEWFFLKPAEPTRSMTLTAYSTRVSGHGVRLLQASGAGKPATIKRTEKEDVLSIQTTGSTDILVEPTGNKPIRLDRRRYTIGPADVRTIEGRSWIRFQHRGDRWQKISPLEPLPQAHRVHSMMDLRWDGVIFVPGTLGDDRENRTLRRLAESLARRWTTGVDSPAHDGVPHDATVRYEVIKDSDLLDEQMSRRHLILIGTPRTNLLLARYHGRLACEWPAHDEDDEAVDRFRFREHTYTLPDAGLVFLQKHPDHPGQAIVVITGTTLEAIGVVDRLRLTLLPSYLLWEGPKVTTYGHWPGGLSAE